MLCEKPSIDSPDLEPRSSACTSMTALSMGVMGQFCWTTRPASPVRKMPAPTRTRFSVSRLSTPSKPGWKGLAMPRFLVQISLHLLPGTVSHWYD
ncbi:unnamed protein product [Linum tenue]|uniref:Uncharacterized protein n=1 Tax=Linum tenue TaxID=586396 RepID=A0AAV0LJ53_9ROSI|nr:unnamed protein product [Linum tenue]